MNTRLTGDVIAAAIDVHRTLGPGLLETAYQAVKTIERIHEAQLLTYMKLGGWRLGLLINFNAHLLRSGVRRMVL